MVVTVGGQVVDEAPAQDAPLPPDPEGRNDDRAGWAGTALTAFMAETGTDKEDAVCDLIADIGHWCDRNGIDFARQIKRGFYHYASETSADTEIDADQSFELMLSAMEDILRARKEAE